MSTIQEDSRDYVVVIGDIVGSRRLPDRAMAQDRLREAVAAFNAASSYELAAPLDVTGGDEIKTILDDPVVCVDVITRLSEALHPMEMAWGVGRGPITTSWVPDVGNLDGPCFHRARQASEEASKDGIWARAHGFSPLDDRTLGTLFRLTGAIRGGWTDKQIAYIRSARQRSQKATAAEFDVTEGAVSQSLQRARFADVEEAEATLRELLARYRPGTESAGRSEDEA
ncbi:MAG: SatD family protein [Gemmatimonadota bacterium]